MKAREVILGFEFERLGMAGKIKMDGSDVERLISCLAGAGYAIVPIEPSERMIEAGVHGWSRPTTFEKQAKHGTSVGGSWLTDTGEAIVNLRDVTEEDMDEEGPYKDSK